MNHSFHWKLILEYQEQVLKNIFIQIGQGNR
jgi:hypothetical protein